jgi:hypothetical protein
METKYVKEKPTENLQNEKNSSQYYLWLQQFTLTTDCFINNFQPTIRNSLLGERKQGIQWGLRAPLGVTVSCLRFTGKIGKQVFFSPCSFDTLHG